MLLSGGIANQPSSPHTSPCTVSRFQEYTCSRNTLLLSVASVWEMQIKLQLGKLKLKLPLAEIVESQRQRNNILVLPIALAHVLTLEELPTQ
jgi:PIN domain nuclease of toxin-antitoxin system